MSLSFGNVEYSRCARSPLPSPFIPFPREYRGMKYDYWICQKQLCHGHLLAGREIKLREIVTIGDYIARGNAYA